MNSEMESIAHPKMLLVLDLLRELGEQVLNEQKVETARESSIKSNKPAEVINARTDRECDEG